MMWGEAALDRASLRPHANLIQSWTVSGKLPHEGYLLGGPVLGTDGLALTPLRPQSLAGGSQEECGSAQCCSQGDAVS